MMTLISPWGCKSGGRPQRKKGWDEVKESDAASDGNWCIASETSESAYSWDIKRAGKAETVDDGNSLEYN